MVASESELVLQGLRRIRDELSDGSGHPVVLTEGLAEQLEREHGIPSAVFARAMTELARAGVIAGRPLIGTSTNWHVTRIE